MIEFRKDERVLRDGYVIGAIRWNTQDEYYFVPFDEHPLSACEMVQIAERMKELLQQYIEARVHINSGRRSAY